MGSGSLRERLKQESGFLARAGAFLLLVVVVLFPALSRNDGSRHIAAQAWVARSPSGLIPITKAQARNPMQGTDVAGSFALIEQHAPNYLTPFPAPISDQRSWYWTDSIIEIESRGDPAAIAAMRTIARASMRQSGFADLERRCPGYAGGTESSYRLRYIALNITWLLVIGALLACLRIVLVGTRDERAQRRIFEGKCPSCAYDMEGGILQTCPECGHRLSDRERQRLEQRLEEIKESRNQV